MNDPDLLSAAMAAAGYESTGRFAAEVLNVDQRDVRRWKSGEREMQGTARVVCVAILSRPALAIELARIRASMHVEHGVEATTPSEQDPIAGDPRWLALIEAFCRVMDEHRQDTGVLQASDAPDRRLRLPLDGVRFWIWRPTASDLEKPAREVAIRAYASYKTFQKTPQG